MVSTQTCEYRSWLVDTGPTPLSQARIFAAEFYFTFGFIKPVSETDPIRTQMKARTV